jgi:hypothetical protein
VGHGGSDGVTSAASLCGSRIAFADSGSADIDLLNAVDAVPGISATTIARTLLMSRRCERATAGVWGESAGNGEYAVPDTTNRITGSHSSACRRPFDGDAPHVCRLGRCLS